MPTAYFDVDGTLVDTNLIHPTVHYLRHQANPLDGIRRIGKALLQAPLLLGAEMRDRRLFNEMLFANYKGMSEDRLLVLSEEVWEDVLRPKIFDGAAELVAKCIEVGLRVVLVTGSLDITVAPLAAHLGADRVIANRLEMHRGYATGKLLRPVVAGPTKAKLIADDARSVGHDLSKCHAYSDSHSDVPMLSVVGHPFCIHPDSKLRRLAIAYDWAILDIHQSTTKIQAP
jgi:HAD superfamily hydrolase (TIGR01490 family)